MAKKILLVDDADDIRKIAGFILKKEGYEVCEAVDGDRALTMIQNESPDLVLLDLNLPLVDGSDVCKRVKADDALKRIPILFLTASDAGYVDEKIQECGANGFLKKPFHAEQLKDKVKEYL